jgi:hypothetical protein
MVISIARWRKDHIVLQQRNHGPRRLNRVYADYYIKDGIAVGHPHDASSRPHTVMTRGTGERPINTL